MAIIHFVNRPKSQTKAGLLFLLRYTMRDDKTISAGKKLVTGINCTPSCAYTQFRNTKLLYGKDSGRQYYHFVQSFPVSEHVSPELAHEIALRFISETDKFNGFEVVAATHCDREHTHTHFVLNSVNAETGLKFHIEQKEIELLMKASDRIISDYGLSICAPAQNKMSDHISDREYRTLDKSQSWKLDLSIMIDECMRSAKSKLHFKWLMEQEGYGVKWTDERKNITYTCPNGKKCCDDKLHDTRYLKEKMEYEFRIRQKINRGVQARSDLTHENSGESRAVSDADRAELESGYRIDGYAEPMAGATVTDTGNTDDRRRYAKAASPSDIGADKSISGTADKYAEYFQVNENGEHEYVLTGWENERNDLVLSQRTAEQNEKIYEAAVSDFNIGKLDMFIDAAYLAAGISDLIDEDGEIIDCTRMQEGETRQQKEERMKRNGYTGPVLDR